MARSDPARWAVVALVALAAAGCSRGARWEAHALAHPAGGGWSLAELRVQGSRPPGEDLGTACEGTLALTDQGAVRVLEIRVPVHPLDAAALRAAVPAVSAAEADDLLKLVSGACLGPKAGFPRTPALVVVEAEQRYR